MRALIPLVVNTPSPKLIETDSLGTQASLAIDVPASVTVATLNVAPVPPPPVTA